MAKRGPKPSGEERVVYYRRVPPEWVDRLDAFISTNGAVRDVGYRERLADQPNGLESKGMEVKGAAGFKELADVKTPPITQDQLPLLKKLAEREGQLVEMTKSYQEEFEKVAALEKEVGLFEKRREAWLRATDDQKTSYWRDRALVAETQLKGKTNEFDQG